MCGPGEFATATGREGATQVCKVCFGEYTTERDTWVDTIALPEYGGGGRGTEGILARVDVLLMRIYQRCSSAKVRGKFEYGLPGVNSMPAVIQLWRESVEKYDRHCPLLGIPYGYTKVRGKRNANAPSLDRIDPTRGYTMDNIWIISEKANRMKQDATAEELTTFSRNWLKHTDE